MAGDKELRVKLTAETDTDAVEEFADAIEEVPEKVETDLAVDAGDSRAVVEDVLADLDKIAKTDPTVNVAVKVDDAALDRARSKMKATGDQAISSVGPLRDVAGAFGGVNTAALDMGESLLGVGDTLATLNPKFAGLAGILGKIGFVGAGVGLGVGLLGTLFSKMNEESEKARKAIEDFAKALRDTQGDIKEAARERALEAWLKPIQGTGGKAAIDFIDELGLTFEQVAAAVDGKASPAVDRYMKLLAGVNAAQATPEGMRDRGKAWKEYAESVGLSTEELERIIPAASALKKEIENSGSTIRGGVEDFRQFERVFGEVTPKVEAFADGMRATDSATEQYVEGVRAAAEITAEHAHSVDTLTDAQARANEQLAEMTGAILSAAEARVAALDAEQQFLDLQKEGKATTDELVVAAVNLAEAHAAQEEAQALANGETVNATTKQASLIESLKATADQASGPTKDAILAVVDQLEKVPPEVNSTMTVNNAEALRKLNEQIRLMQIIRDTSAETLAAYRAIPGGARGALVGVPTQGITQNITVNAGFGTDAFAVRSAVLSSARQAARLTQNAVKFVR